MARTEIDLDQTAATGLAQIHEKEYWTEIPVDHDILLIGLALDIMKSAEGRPKEVEQL